MLDLSLCEIFESVFHVIIFIQLEIQVYVILLLLLCLPFSRNVTQSRFRSRNLKVFVKDFQIAESIFKSSLCIFRVRYYRIGNCVDWRFSFKTLLNWYFWSSVKSTLVIHSWNSQFRIGQCVC